MKKLRLLSLFLLPICGFVGCIEAGVTDIRGWDLSACVSGFDTCYELFMDNSNLILDGENNVIYTLGSIDGVEYVF